MWMSVFRSSLSIFSPPLSGIEKGRSFFLIFHIITVFRSVLIVTEALVILNNTNRD